MCSAHCSCVYPSVSIRRMASYSSTDICTTPLSFEAALSGPYRLLSGRQQTRLHLKGLGIFFTSFYLRRPQDTSQPPQSFTGSSIDHRLDQALPEALRAAVQTLLFAWPQDKHPQNHGQSHGLACPRVRRGAGIRFHGQGIVHLPTRLRIRPILFLSLLPHPSVRFRLFLAYHFTSVHYWHMPITISVYSFIGICQ